MGTADKLDIPVAILAGYGGYTFSIVYLNKINE